MKNTLLSLSIIVFVILTPLNVIFFTEIVKNEDLREFYLKNKELPDNYLEKEKIHMQEVKHLTNISMLLNLISLAPIIFLRKERVNKKLIGISLTITSILLLICAIAFENFFTTFHRIFFNSENWILPSNSILIQTYPLTFFRSRFIALTTTILLIGIYFTSRGITLKGLSKKPQRK